MPNEVDLYSGGGVQPYAPSPQPLVPTAEDNWGSTDVDYLGGNQHSGALQFFGQPLPPDATAQHVERGMAMIAGSYRASMASWGNPTRWIDAATTWFNTAATQPPRRETKRHNYDLHSQAGDLVAESFANYMARFNASQEFISNSIYFIEELERQQGQQQVTEGHDRPHAMEGNPTSIDQLSDAQFERVVQLNAELQARTMDRLSRKWGKYTVHQNIALAQKYLDSLPEADQAFFDQYLQDWTHNLNHAETLEFLYGQAIGIGSIPTSGAGIAVEIAQIESVMGTALYRKDERLQARYRHLLTLRDG